MLYSIVIMGVIILSVVLPRHFALKKEIKNVKKQLAIYNKRETDKKIDIALLDHDLENLVAEINRLIELNVREKQKWLNTAKAHKDAIANMSHDLRTPLTSIQGYIQMAKKNSVSDEERKDLLRIASERAKRLEDLLNDFFELSIIETSDDVLNLTEVNLQGIAMDVLMSFYDRFSEKGLEPDISFPDKSIFIKADEAAVTRVLENLFSNVLTHSDGDVSIRLEEVDEAVKLVVENKAPRLTVQDVAHLFDRFYMADRSRTKSGTGLGLAIAKSLMEKMNADISAHLHEGKLAIVCKWKKVNKKTSK